ncbi:GNAT family N-acetyltransferase [Noviherbaspirillum malthae]|jgi:predicted GNAT family acetyltransferase|uniref:GNAT family N-acetyltransferase n=1 Tax=Noviherbaspirillum malthae TaxID=1260987 RepID=UPI00188F82D9|nr:GNAT family N-acetyltransferase [Noviherbaspirillum malthae]
MNGTTLKDNSGAQRYELMADGQLIGFAQYRPAGDAVAIIHTEIAPEHGGKGYGSALAKQALDRIREERKRVIPACGFIADYIGKHSEYADLVADS